MNEIIIPATKRLRYPDGIHLFYEIPQENRISYAFWMQQQDSKDIHFDKIVIRKPYKPRTTGDKSQNHHINGHIQQLCIYTGYDFDTLKYYFKKKAIRRGYPFDSLPITGDRLVDGDPIPWSETRIDIDQAKFLIDEIHQFADENSFVLEEE